MVGSSNPSIWGTWEDLLLAYAVRRHGTDCWDSVAAELRHRSSYGHLLNPRCCHLRFNQLHRRFSTGNPFADTLEAPSDVPWLEDLRRLRVAELRRDVQRYDASIMSLQKKVKTLTEEACETPDSGAGDPDRISYRSSKESNMADPDQEARREPDPAADGSCHGSTATEVKESGDAQSSACLTNRWSWRRRKQTSPDKELEGGPITVETTKMKSQPLMLFLEMITSDKLCSVFMRKLESQMSEKYEQVIRRHMDLETVREQLLRDHQQGAYITIHMYRDLLLICNNASVFYTKGSREYSAALHLRHLCRPRHHISMPTLLACGRQRETALEPVTVKVKTKEKAKNKKVARKTKNKKGRRGSSSSSNLTVVKKNKVRSSPSVESEVEKKKKKKSGKQPVRQAKRGATVTKQHIQPVKKRIASSAPASTPPEKRARKSPESKRATAKPPPPPAAAKKPRPRRR